jgi:hypothetical protein
MIAYKENKTDENGLVTTKEKQTLTYNC